MGSSSSSFLDLALFLPEPSAAEILRLGAASAMEEAATAAAARAAAAGSIRIGGIGGIDGGWVVGPGGPIAARLGGCDTPAAARAAMCWAWCEEVAPEAAAAALALALA